MELRKIHRTVMACALPGAILCAGLTVLLYGALGMALLRGFATSGDRLLFILGAWALSTAQIGLLVCIVFYMLQKWQAHTTGQDDDKDKKPAGDANPWLMRRVILICGYWMLIGGLLMQLVMLILFLRYAWLHGA